MRLVMTTMMMMMMMKMIAMGVTALMVNTCAALKNL